MRATIKYPFLIHKVRIPNVQYFAIQNLFRQFHLNFESNTVTTHAVCVYWVFTDVYQSDMIIYVWGPTFKRHHPKDVAQFRTCVLS